MHIVYPPKGPAGEYAEWALNAIIGCPFGCKTCYCPGQLRMRRWQFHKQPRPRPDVIYLLEKDARRLARKQAETGRPVRVLMSFLSDPCQPLDQKLGLTVKALDVLHRHGLGAVILTKAGLDSVPYLDHMDPATDEYWCSLTWMDPDKSLEWEPKAALPDSRLQALEAAKARGFFTQVSLEPIYSANQTEALVTASCQWVDIYRPGKLQHHGLASTLNWEAITQKVIRTLMEHGCFYITKHALRPHLNGQPATCLPTGDGGPEYQAMVARCSYWLEVSERALSTGNTPQAGKSTSLAMLMG